MLFDRRSFFKLVLGGTAAAAAWGKPGLQDSRRSLQNSIFSITHIPDFPYTIAGHPNRYVGFEGLIRLMSQGGLKLYRTSAESLLGGPLGLIAPNDIVLIKVNAQWKYRGATNSDLVRGIIQRILDHPDGFTGEVVIFENGQGRGTLNCDQGPPIYGDYTRHANAFNELQSFRFLVDQVFNDPRVSALLLDPYRHSFLTAGDHVNFGYRKLENVSYPCFTTPRGTRVELKEGIWTGGGYTQNLKLINVPVLKAHGGSQITAALKHFYGVLSMEDGKSGERHYSKHGECCGKMVSMVRAPVLNVLDAMWVSFKNVLGWPAEDTFKAARVVASQDPLALDYWGSKYILYPVENNPELHPEDPIITYWMAEAAQVINSRGGLTNPDQGIFIDKVTSREDQMLVIENRAADAAALNDLPAAPRRRVRTALAGGA